jgi:hypothetical protein
MVGQAADEYSIEKKDYPAYCVYIPTGMDEEFEKPILDKLKKWGNNMGKNLYVAPWNIGDPSYVQLTNRIGFKNRPAIILTDTDIISLDKYSFMLILDDPQLIRDAPKLFGVLPALLDLILRKDYRDATKAAIEARKIAKLKSLSKDIESVLDKVKITFSWKGVGVESK